ncbi:NAD(P)-binding protein [Macrolepiota fuliginosa MF-IS2]|uniref:NAD(P)-binding protein n=1 Tax=Macrolepiota fuliginosa MF-IS2 TaxID=1400762 RepID=A0A9P5XBV1_9AGAR|nr:NAD(P)-binding protein [Macrolepiota fuliginosa MF-IS2]
MASAKLNVLFLGATGFLGSQFLCLISRDPELRDKFHIIALCRNSQQRLPELQKLYPDLEVVEGTLESDAIIQEQATKADIVINTASSDHIESVKSTLKGLEKNSAANPNKPPIYIQISGLGITSDNSHGVYVDIDDIPCYTDIGLSLNDVPAGNHHVAQDKLIVEAGTRKENPVRTLIVFPGWIYGIGEGIQKTTLPVRIFTDLFLQAGRAGTWGEGHSRMGNAHVKDVASAVVTVLKAALEGRADEGAEGFYFAISKQPMVTNREIAALMGDILFEKGLVKEPGSRALSNELVDPMGEYGWSLLGANQSAYPHRLSRFGWKPTETKKKLLLESLRDELELHLRETGKIPK